MVFEVFLIFLRLGLTSFGGAVVLLASLIRLVSPVANAGTDEREVEKEFSAIETSNHARLGVWALRVDDGRTFEFRSHERFPFCSTFKVFVAAAALKRAETEKGLLDETLALSKADISQAGYSPITKTHDRMKVRDLASAAIEYSDNAAANALLKRLGGPVALNNFALSMKDQSFHLDRPEPALNSALPGDDRDTTTPSAMGHSLQQLALEHALAESSRLQLVQWMKANTTGDKRIRASVPRDWTVGDKTGTGDFGTTNDIAILWPPQSSPIVLVVFFTQTQKDAPPRDAAVAQAAAAVVRGFDSSRPRAGP